jgi:hypothetical protein
MQYQLILQFRGDARRHFNEITNPAARLAETLGDTADFDGEDIGAHGANLFLFTETPRETLASALTVFPGAESAAGFSAAYRQVSSESFHVICPADSSAEFRLR